MVDHGCSELEAVVLGLVWKKGPCTAHAVRIEFAASQSSHWSGSAGSIYPLMRRLEEHGLLASRQEEVGRRPRRLYSITAAGRKALRGWLLASDPAVYSVQYDPIRIRAWFLGLLTDRQQQAALERAQQELSTRLEQLDRDHDEYLAQGWIHSAVAVDGVRAVTRARIDWLRRTRRTLARHPGARR
jgi:DNA-binding PadR family transcriptional regulator